MATPPTYADDWSGQFLRLAADATEAQQTWIDARLEEAWDQFPSSYWGRHRAKACLLHVGHLWEMEMGASNNASARPAGQVTGRSTSSWSTTHAAIRAQAVSGTDGWYMLTSSGQQLLHLRESLYLGPMATG